MKRSLISPKLIVGLVVILLFAVACDQPDQQLPLATEGANPQEVSPETPTLEPGGMPPGIQNTVEAGTTAEVTPLPTEEATPLPALEATPTPTEIPAVVATSTPTPIAMATATPVPGGGTTYVVQQGDRLFSIGRLFNVNPYAIAQANSLAAPYIIYPGQKLVIPGSSGTTPPPAGGNTYTVRPGDNLFRIALKFGRSMQAIAAANNIANINFIYVGQVLTIP